MSFFTPPFCSTLAKWSSFAYPWGSSGYQATVECDHVHAKAFSKLLVRIIIEQLNEVEWMMNNNVANNNKKDVKLLEWRFLLKILSWFLNRKFM